jgi:hypothetical protein
VSASVEGEHGRGRDGD